MTVAAPSRQRRLRQATYAATLALAAASCLRWHSVRSCSADATFIAGGDGVSALRRAVAGRGGGNVALTAYSPLIRRDPSVNDNMQRWLVMMQTNLKRLGKVAPVADERKKEYLRSLGVKVPDDTFTWHENHLAVGDVLVGSITHPDCDSIDVTLTIVSPEKGRWTSKKGEFEEDVEFYQDFPIRGTKGKDRTDDMIAYVFSKFNKKWRDFSGPMPTPEELEYISLGGLRLFFEVAAKARDFPSEEVFREAVADPEKGMSKEEFYKFVLEEDPEYLENTWIGYFTGRRAYFADSDFKLEGDFIKGAPGFILGYVELKGKPGGTFTLELKSTGK